MYLNKVLLIGYAGSDPEVHYYAENQAAATFNLAVTRPSFRNNNGQLVPEQTDWIRIASFFQSARYAEENIRKGSRVLVEGRLSSRQYTDKKGVTHSVTEVIAEKLSLLDKNSTRKA